jgi:hypothetical protein
MIKLLKKLFTRKPTEAELQAQHLNRLASATLLGIALNAGKKDR